MDGESAAINIADLINVPWFQALVQGVHYVIVDARIRKIMEEMRSILSELPFKILSYAWLGGTLYCIRD